MRIDATKVRPQGRTFSFFGRVATVLPTIRRTIASGVLAAGLAGAGAISTAAAQSGDAARGEYLAKAGGCLGCHTEPRQGATPYAGGRELKTPFGTFYGPNITPHPAQGLGRWTEADFRRAMREGVRPDGAHYFPAFPYTSFTKITDSDAGHLWAYLKSLPPSDRPSRPHDLSFPFNIRLLVWFWKFMNFTPGPFRPDASKPAAINRGAYLVEALGHCGECHTPRDFLGGLKSTALAGAAVGPGGGKIPNLTPTGLGQWADADLKEFLTSGMTPEGDVAGGEMAEVIRNSTSQLVTDDMAALVAYLRTVPPQPAPGR
ncbi:MAG: cytochrome c [Alphaproteobacteria bacterium]|nr:cytochrome c [Alphaproteobacteria bacterium]